VNEALTLLSEAPQITIAALHGPIAGAGMSIALCLDLAIAADSAVFHYAYASVAAPPDCGGSWALPRLVGWRTAMDIALFGAPIPAARALQLGLVSRVVPDAELLAETRRMSDRIKAVAPLALGKTKRLFRTSLQNDLPTQLVAEADAFAACAGTDAFEAAIDGFFQRGKAKDKRPHAPEGAKPDD
jgi:2-(1,2-epoxy-1,2-dihydrophenyl)acetyl-CoA isomerase